MNGLLAYDIVLLRRQKWLRYQPLLVALYLLLRMDLSLLMIFLNITLESILLMDLQSSLSPAAGRFLFTLPLNRRIFVLEKYLLILGLGILQMLIAAAAYCFFLPETVSHVAADLSVCLLWLILFTALLLPLTIRFGNLYRIWMVVCLFFTAGFLSFLLEWTKLPDTPFWHSLLADPVPVLLILALVSAILLAVSICISLRLMSQKEL